MNCGTNLPPTELEIHNKENTMFRALILWLLGVPFILVLIIWYFFF
ncbi:hypothetical protein OHAE_1086 [Ochrobactrum soli]|uniref:Uncharacterized protein n=1 Tax=Ochrobactrum soli TaxID=2448455 RepID=A0A2P9HMC6_9HYPH|nr:hypothetical protein OHAE_1086 [[Ochrobactrum] soli]